MYMPELGRFTARDPIPESGVLVGGIPQSSYWYADNNPTNRIDPSGLLSRTVAGQSVGPNGQFSVSWKFSLDRAYRDPIILVQRIRVESLIWVCKVCPDNQRLCCNREKVLRNCIGHYYEVIGFILPGERTIRQDYHGGEKNMKALRDMGQNVQLPVLERGIQAIDDTWIQPPTTVNSCGFHQMQGVVKAFTLNRNVINATDQWMRVIQGGGNETVCNMSSGLLFGSVEAPRFWNLGNVPAFRTHEEEQPVTVRAVWDCPPSKTSFTILTPDDTEIWPRAKQ
jgi:hypothetical protein